MTEFDGRGSEEAKAEPKVINYSGFGEITIGANDPLKVLIIAVCMLNNPEVNKFLLDNKLKMADRFTKAPIFPREGMALPGDAVYSTES